MGLSSTLIYTSELILLLHVTRPIWKEKFIVSQQNEECAAGIRIKRCLPQKWKHYASNALTCSLALFSLAHNNLNLWKLWRGRMARNPKHLPYIRPKSRKNPYFRMFELPRSPSCLMNYCLWLYCKWLEWMTEVEYILQVLSIMMKYYVASSKNNTEHSKQFKTGVQKPYPVWDQNDQNRYSISDQNVFKKPHPLRLHIPLQPIEGSTALSPWAVKGKYHK